MQNDYNRIIYRDGKKWINHRIDGYGPDSGHYQLCNAILRATKSIKKDGNGCITVKDSNNQILFDAKVE